MAVLSPGVRKQISSRRREKTVDAPAAPETRRGGGVSKSERFNISYAETGRSRLLRNPKIFVVDKSNLMPSHLILISIPLQLVFSAVDLLCRSVKHLLENVQEICRIRWP